MGQGSGPDADPFSAWPEGYRQQVADHGRRRQRAAAAWLRAAAAGVALGCVVLAVGRPGVDTTGIGFVLAALAVDAVALLLCRHGWATVVRVADGRVRPPASLAGVRLRTGLLAMAGLVLSMVGAVLSVLGPAVAFHQRTAGWTELGSVVVVALAVGCGCALRFLWVRALPAPSPARAGSPAAVRTPLR